MSQPKPPPLKRSFWRSRIGWLAIAGIALGTFLVLGLTVLYVGSQTGYLPDTKAIPGENLQPRVLELLRQEGFVEPDEEVLYFYSAGFLSFLDDGNLFTDRRVISYAQWEGPEVQIFSATYPEVLEIEPTWSNSLFEDSVLTIHTATHEFELWVSNEGKRDREFYRRLIETWEDRR